MTTKQFIQANLWNNNGVEKTCSSVFTDGHGNFYSYGYHYPLLVRINGDFYLNDAGYSSTTSKHIRWARSYSDYVYNYGRNTDTRRDAVLECIKKEIESNEKRIQELSKRAWRQKQNLVDRNNELIPGLRALSVSEQKASAPSDNLKTISMVAAFGNLLCNTQKEKNDWKARMLKAGLENKGLDMPEDWDQLTEDEKENRLNGAINALK